MTAGAFQDHLGPQGFGSAVFLGIVELMRIKNVNNKYKEKKELMTP